jgi:hypothetical protein
MILKNASPLLNTMGFRLLLKLERIAYLDAFVSVLITLPHGDGEEDWLNQRIKTAQNWLLSQGLTQPK